MSAKIIAHRGASRLAHENTLEAFQKAIDLGADAIELDVRKTKEGIIVVFHDPQINGRGLNEITYSELNKISQGYNFTVPTLEQVLLKVVGKCHLFIEIKDVGYELEVASLALKFLKPEDFTIISFNFKSLKEIKIKFHQVQTGLILGSWGLKMLQTAEFFLKRKASLNYLDLLAIDLNLWKYGFFWLVPKNFRVNVWTVDSSEIIVKVLKDPKVNFITTNVPDLALRIRSTI